MAPSAAVRVAGVALLLAGLLAGMAAPDAFAAPAFEAATAGHARYGPGEVAGGAETAGDAATVAVAATGVTAAVPLQLHAGATVVVNGLAYDRLRLTYGGDAPPPAPGVTALHALRYRFALAQRLGETVRLVVYQEPGLWSDLHEVEGSHLRLEGGALVQVQGGPRTRAGLGVAYTSLSGEPSLAPYATYTHEGPLVRLELVVPSDMEGYLRAGRGLELGAAVRVQGAAYRIGRDDAPVDGLRYSVTTAAVKARVPAARPLVLEVEAGRTLRRRFEPLAGGRPVGPDSLGNAGFARIVVALVF